MPHSAPKSCSFPGCDNPARTSRCIEHKGKSRKRERTTSSRVYDTPAWRALSKRVRREEPTCRIRLVCMGAPSEVADHIVEVEDGGARFDRANVQGACIACNVAKGQHAAAARRRRVG